jgi:predicted component of type VI protein secretion system
MTGLELFGFAAVTVMVTAYALEERSPVFVLLFAVSCLAAAAYAALIHSWPFAVVETLWSGIAFSRWLKRRSRSS